MIAAHPLWRHFDACPPLNRRAAASPVRRMAIAAIEDALSARDCSVEDVSDIAWHGLSFLDMGEDSISYDVSVVLFGHRRHGLPDFRIKYCRNTGYVLDDWTHHHTGPLAAAA